MSDLFQDMLHVVVCLAASTKLLHWYYSTYRTPVCPGTSGREIVRSLGLIHKMNNGVSLQWAREYC
jgi:hypothetical protein